MFNDHIDELVAENKKDPLFKENGPEQYEDAFDYYNQMSEEERQENYRLDQLHGDK